MFKFLYFKNNPVYECAKMHKKVNNILTSFEVNTILQSNLDNRQKYVIRRFLMQELGCLNGIVKSLKNDN